LFLSQNRMQGGPSLEHSKSKQSKSEGGPRAFLRNRFGALARQLARQTYCDIRG
jgi:hypothetical protein